MLLFAVVAVFNALLPMAVLLLPDTLDCIVTKPKAVLFEPTVFEKSDLLPTAALKEA